MAAPKIDVAALSDRIARFSPGLSLMAVSKFLGFGSPFNGVLGAKLVEWTPERAVMRLKNRRRIQNHLGSTHAAALVALGESVAGILLLRNFSFGDYRIILKDLTAEYFKQGRGRLRAETSLEPDRRAGIEDALRRDAVFVDMVTRITRDDGEVVAEVRTNWQLKRWDQVGKKPAQKVNGEARV